MARGRRDILGLLHIHADHGTDRGGIGRIAPSICPGNGPEPQVGPAPADLLLVESQVFIARQPILDRSRRVVAYELLSRPSRDADIAGGASAQTSARVVTDAVMAFGLDTLTQGKPAFINVTRSLLLGGLTGLEAILPPSKVVLELLEDIEADPEVLEACAALRRAGYALALDDFVLRERTAGLVPMADYVKVDVLGAPDPRLRDALVSLSPARPPAMLAEKVEDVGQFDAAFADGYDYFQGFFFDRPTTHRARGIPGHRLGHLRLLRALQDPDLDVTRLEQLIERDVSSCYRILRTVNSAGYAQANAVASIRQAVVLIGVGTVRRWVSLWLLAGLGEEVHPELITMSAVRARCCEVLAAQVPGDGAVSEGFLLGLCSLLDAILNQPMPAVVEQLPLSAPTQAALVGEDNVGRRLLDCVVAQERGEWERSRELAGRVGLSPEALAAAHQDALRWSGAFLQATGTA
jgi:EAL and modified HD-GYP domain-containing signal transduction protein